MANVRDVRQKLRIAMAVLVGLNVFAIGALVYMMVRGTSQLPSEFHSLHQQVQNKKSIIVPPATVDERVKEAREQIAHSMRIGSPTVQRLFSRHSAKWPVPTTFA